MEIPPKTAPRLFLIDAYALIYRSFFAFISRPLTNSRGENTSAPFGFANFLERVRDELEPDYMAVVFDAGMSFREKIYPAYKATREKMPDELRASLPRIRAVLDAYHDPVVELDGYEADDVIGTLASKAVAAGLEAVIVSGDSDGGLPSAGSPFAASPAAGRDGFVAVFSSAACGAPTPLTTIPSNGATSRARARCFDSSSSWASAWSSRARRMATCVRS